MDLVPFRCRWNRVLKLQAPSTMVQLRSMVGWRKASRRFRAHASVALAHQATEDHVYQLQTPDGGEHPQNSCARKTLRMLISFSSINHQMKRGSAICLVTIPSLHHDQISGKRFSVR
jgi:hypothetical protein